MTEFQSTHPTRGCDILIEVIYVAAVISIHAPHEGVRRGGTGLSRKGNVISIHAPHEGVRRDRQVKQQRIVQFQSTHPTRGCDVKFAHAFRKSSPISIHAPHEGVRHGRFRRRIHPVHFNPRTPRGGATRKSLFQLRLIHFNPRTPRGGATAICCSLISRVTTCCRPNITPLLDVVRFLNYCTNLLLFLGEPPRLFRTASGSPMSLHY